MSDVTYPNVRSSVSPLYLRDEELKHGAGLLFLAYAELSAGDDKPLVKAGLGRAHGRALLVIAQHPGITVGALLRRLHVTKQSANRVLNELLLAGYVARRPAAGDRRMRELRLTAKGESLDEALWEGQRPRLVRAFREAGPDAVSGFCRVLNALVPQQNAGRPGRPR